MKSYRNLSTQAKIASMRAKVAVNKLGTYVPLIKITLTTAREISVSAKSNESESQ